MTKYHINPETGNPGVCRATKRCRFGDLESDHFESKEAARAAFEQRQQSSTVTVTKPTLAEQEKKLMLLRQETMDRIGEAFKRVPGRIGYSYELAIPREEYDQLKDTLRETEEPLRKLRKELRTDQLEPHHPDVPQVFGLEDAQRELMTQVNDAGEYYKDNPRERYYFGENAAEELPQVLARFHAGEEVKESESMMVLPEDKLLFLLNDSNNGIMSTSAMQAALVFPERDLKPVLERLGVENVSVAPFYNNREWGLVYTVLDPKGNTRSFSLYEHRNSDSLIINGETNWSREEHPYGPYGKKDEDGNPAPDGAVSKNHFFAEFAAEDYRQAAETLGYFLKEAQKGELEDDVTLTNKADHRDWNAILSEQIPGFKTWLEDQGIKEEKRWFEED